MFFIFFATSENFFHNINYHMSRRCRAKSIHITHQDSAKSAHWFHSHMLSYGAQNVFQNSLHSILHYSTFLTIFRHWLRFFGVPTFKATVPLLKSFTRPGPSSPHRKPPLAYLLWNKLFNHLFMPDSIE